MLLDRLGRDAELHEHRHDDREISPHLADAEPTRRFTAPTRNTMPTIVTGPGRFMALSAAAPLTARRIPIWDWPNIQMNREQKKARTM